MLDFDAQLDLRTIQEFEYCSETLIRYFYSVPLEMFGDFHVSLKVSAQFHQQFNNRNISSFIIWISGYTFKH